MVCQGRYNVARGFLGKICVGQYDTSDFARPKFPAHDSTVQYKSENGTEYVLQSTVSERRVGWRGPEGWFLRFDFWMLLVQAHVGPPNCLLCFPCLPPPSWKHSLVVNLLQFFDACKGYRCCCYLVVKDQFKW